MSWHEYDAKIRNIERICDNLTVQNNEIHKTARELVDALASRERQHAEDDRLMNERVTDLERRVQELEAILHSPEPEAGPGVIH